MIDYLFGELHKNSLAVFDGILQGMLMFIKKIVKGTCVLGHNEKVFWNLDYQLNLRPYQNYQTKQLFQPTLIQYYTATPKPVLSKPTTKQEVLCITVLFPSCLRGLLKKQDVAA